MNIPAELSPEVATWMRLQMSIAASRAVEPLKAEIDAVDDWANGLFVVISQVLPYLMMQNPEMGRALQANWSEAAQMYERIDQGLEDATDDEPLGMLEARKILYRTFDVSGVWAKVQSESQAAGKTQRRRA